MGKALGTYRTVRYRVGVRYSECPLKEVLLDFLDEVVVVTSGFAYIMNILFCIFSSIHSVGQ